MRSIELPLYCTAGASSGEVLGACSLSSRGEELRYRALAAQAGLAVRVQTAPRVDDSPDRISGIVAACTSKLERAAWGFINRRLVAQSGWDVGADIPCAVTGFG